MRKFAGGLTVFLTVDIPPVYSTLDRQADLPSREESRVTQPAFFRRAE